MYWKTLLKQLINSFYTINKNITITVGNILQGESSHSSYDAKIKIIKEITRTQHRGFFSTILGGTSILGGVTAFTAYQNDQRKIAFDSSTTENKEYITKFKDIFTAEKFPADSQDWDKRRKLIAEFLATADELTKESIKSYTTAGNIEPFNRYISNIFGIKRKCNKAMNQLHGDLIAFASTYERWLESLGKQENPFQEHPSQNPLMEALYAQAKIFRDKHKKNLEILIKDTRVSPKEYEEVLTDLQTRFPDDEKELKNLLKAQTGVRSESDEQELAAIQAAEQDAKEGHLDIGQRTKPRRCFSSTLCKRIFLFSFIF